MTYPSTILNNALEIADDIIQYIQKSPPLPEKIEGSIKLLTNKWFLVTMKIDPRIHRASQLIKLNDLFKSSPKKLHPWLERIETAPDYFLEMHYWYFCGILIKETNPDSTEIVIKIICKLVKHNKELSANVLTLILFKLTKEKTPKILLLLLKSIPEMGVLKENIPLIVNTLESFEKGPKGLQGICVDLFARLWQVEGRCYPYLERVLIKDAKDSSNTSELDIVKALTLKKICILR